MQRYSVTELARGRSRGSPKDMICILADVRGVRPASLQVWCETTQKVVNLPRSLMRIQTIHAKRCFAISLPRWLVDKEHLWTEPKFEGDCDPAEINLAKYAATSENRYVQMPGQRTSIGAYGGAA